jgi:4-hydroxy-3-methylbut-2-en-1-yl diphosphate reductase
MKKFDIPTYYRSPLIGAIKERRKIQDPRKKDFAPLAFTINEVTFVIPRHFGFCYGVENAIEVSYRAIAENPGKRLFLLSEMIHNPAVNEDLQRLGIQFIMTTEGQQLIPWESIVPGDVVITPAFGTTLEIAQMLKDKGVELETYNTTCPFVEKVWKRSAEIGQSGYSIIIHGKYKHEETRATFSHSQSNAPSIIIRDMDEAERLAAFIRGEKSKEEFELEFGSKCSKGFDPVRDLERIGVVNQTTMLATETQAIADYLKNEIIAYHKDETRFIDTRDTLCYATNDNQTATIAARETKADLALVVGGFNSSNTSQIATILEEAMPTFFIADESEMLSAKTIRHCKYGQKELLQTEDWLPDGPLQVVITSGASCPDVVLEAVMRRVLLLKGVKEEALEEAASLLLSNS